MSTYSYVVDIIENNNNLLDVKVEVQGNAPESKLNDIPVIQTYKQLLSFIKKHPFHSILFVKRKSNELIVKRIIELLNEYEVTSNITVLEGMEDADTNKEAYVTFFNGVKTFITGMYPQHFHHTKMKHLLVKDQSEISHDLKTRLLYSSNINSSLLLPEAPTALEELESWFGLAQISLQEKENQHYNVVIKEKVNIHTKEVVVLSFHTFTENPSVKEGDNEIFLTIDTVDDYLSFSATVRHTELTGTLRIMHILPHIKDECMWSHKSVCSLRSGTRLAVGQPNVLQSPVCYSIGKEELTNKPIASVFDREFSKAFILSGCHTCRALPDCPSCIKMAPQTEEKKHYCSIRQTLPFVTEFITIRNILKSFFYGQQRFVSPSETVAFSTKVKKLFYDKESTREKALSSQLYFLFSWKEAVYLYIHRTMKFYKINNLLATYLEGKMLGETEKEIQAYIQEKHNWSLEIYEQFNEKATLFTQKVGLS
ncbi:hypothetical protein [Sutcliffiella cohnii]|uniref:hypothetical protein n=1 Tax=Sutcliffiella cohnii TaxID=33932 RepID=UPI002E1E1B4B|nr:hypothetical protein [Sutcliffiella cohnii]